MSDETVAGSDAVISDSEVSLPKVRYQAILRTLENQDIKLKAMKNLHQILQVKDQELKASNEKAQNLQTALDKAETRLANQIRLSVNGAYQSTLEADSVGQNTASQSEQFVDKSISQTTSSVKTVTNAVEQSSTSSSDLEEDCAVEPVFEPRRTIAVNSQKLSSPPFERVHAQTSKTSHDLPLSNAQSGASVALQTRGVKMSPHSFQSVGKSESTTPLDSMEKVSLSGGQSLKSIGKTGVSRDLLDKLMQQNARLKKVVRDILHQQGISFEGYLDRQESRDVITQLQEELRLSKAQNEKLKEIINSRDSEDISKKYYELRENFLKLKRTATMMQVMADSYSKEYEKLKVENKELKDELSAANQKVRSLELIQQKELSCGEATSPMIAGAEGTIPLRLYETVKVQLDEVLAKLSSTEAERNALCMQCQQQSLKEGVLQKTVDDLRKQCENHNMEKELLKNQVTVFQEDFMAEQQKQAEKRQQLETTLAKHQDWIRKLVAETQKCRSLFEEEKTKRETAVAAKDELEKRFRSFIAESRSMSSCRFEEQRQTKNPRMHLDDLQVDNGGESTSLPPKFLHGSVPSGEASQHEQSDPLVCPRCEREFEAQDEQKWKDHCARCTDD